MQGGCQNAAYPETAHIIRPSWGKHDVFLALNKLNLAVKENNADTRLVYLMPWAFEDGITWLPGQTDTFKDMQLKIYENSIEWCEILDIVLAPVGWVWYQVFLEMNKPHYLYLPDYN